MATTIQVQDDTLKRLKEAKERLGTDSYDELINRLLRKDKRRAGSVFGSHPEMTPFRHGRTGHGD